MLTFHFDLVIMNKNRGVIPDFSRERIMIIMKKTLSIVLALAMVFVMGFSAFAEGEDLTVKPTDPAELGVYYAELLNAEDSDPAAVATEILNDLDTGDGEGIYTVEDLPVVLSAFVENSNDADKLLAAVEQIEAGLTSMGIVLPEIDDVLPPPSGEDEESTLPEDEEPTDDTDFLNTILGILGTIGDMIFGSDDDEVHDDTLGGGDGAWADPDEELGASFAEEFNANGASNELLAEIAEAITSGGVTNATAFGNAFVESSNDKQAAYDFLKEVEAEIQKTDSSFVLSIDPPSGEGNNVPNTGDTTVISVAAVALVAGAALVLTRKKSEDAE